MQEKLGIVIPYRNRKEHLEQSVPILKRIGRVYVIEQMDDKLFNRGKLINIGYIEFKNEFDYFAAHDIDLIPDSDNYSYTEYPCHLATQAQQFGYKMPYPEYFGGVTLFPNKQFEKANGFGNDFWGHGGEDDFIRRRFIEMSIPLQNREMKFESLPHSREYDREAKLLNAKKAKDPIDWKDGLSSCKYEVVNLVEKENYILCQVKI